MRMACLAAAREGGRALAGAVRHQRRHPAARGRAHRRRGGAEDPGRAAGHPHPQRHRERRRQHAGRRARRRAPGPGHDQRAGRALRQRQHDRADPQPRAEDGLRDRPQGRRDAAADPPVAPARRPAERGAQPQRRLCRHPRLRPQGRAARLGGREGPADLRARRSRDWSATSASSWSATRPAAPTSWRASARSGSRSTPRIPAVGRLLEIVKEREAEGYAYDGADASFELLARHELHTVPDYFALHSFRVLAERAGQRARPADRAVRGDGEARRRRPAGDGGGRGQRPGERPRCCAAKGAAAGLSRSSATCGWSTSRCASWTPPAARRRPPAS